MLRAGVARAQLRSLAASSTTRWGRRWAREFCSSARGGSGPAWEAPGMAVMYHSATPMRTASPPRVRRKEIVLLERALELGDEVVHVFDADREAHQAVVDAEV